MGETKSQILRSRGLVHTLRITIYAWLNIFFSIFLNVVFLITPNHYSKMYSVEIRYKIKDSDPASIACKYWRECARIRHKLISDMQCYVITERAIAQESFVQNPIRVNRAMWIWSSLILVEHLLGGSRNRTLRKHKVIYVRNYGEHVRRARQERTLSHSSSPAWSSQKSHDITRENTVPRGYGICVNDSPELAPCTLRRSESGRRRE